MRFDPGSTARIRIRGPERPDGGQAGGPQAGVPDGRWEGGGGATRTQGEAGGGGGAAPATHASGPAGPRGVGGGGWPSFGCSGPLRRGWGGAGRGRCCRGSRRARWCSRLDDVVERNAV